MAGARPWRVPRRSEPDRVRKRRPGLGFRGTPWWSPRPGLGFLGVPRAGARWASGVGVPPPARSRTYPFTLVHAIAPPHPTMFARQTLTPEGLGSALPPLTIEDARRLVAAICRGDLRKAAIEAPDGPVVRGVRRTVVERLLAESREPTLTLLSDTPSQVDPFRKYAFEVEGGFVVETVRIPLERPGRYSVCVSSQAGCALG